ncbi:hypothetical protein [Novosphingobium sp. KN65.2]|uniref:hypothetical protein n=1 Tax=Novosphingobium sp. KN65.2 TaxID=1478134 RepID=UPI0005E6061B|nr:hypothetical protein [Novosphingobium sp. KN65.2]CDO34021.1 hypothetical protein SPHV1_100055 [Novosphingobium sp. KN65.2]
MFNLFDVTTGIEAATGKLAEKPRSATAREVRAYLQWLAQRDGIAIPGNAEYTAAGIEVRGEIVIPMPGYGVPQVVICEIVDDDGNVIRTLPLPADKRGKLPMTAKQVQEWSGLKPVRAPRKAKVKAAPIPVAEPEAAPMPEIGTETAQEAQEPVVMASEAVEAVDAPSGPELASPEPSSQTCELPGVDHCGDVNEMTTDPIAKIEARLAELEARVDALPAQSDITPIVEAQPKRTAAHERAIRRAWAERKARRETADLDRRALEAANTAYREAEAERLRVADLAREARAERDALQYCFDQVAANYRKAKTRRLASAQRARRMIAAARAATQARQQAHDVTRSQLAKLRRDMADPSQPERASDVARLMRERDEARNANAALQARAERSEQAVINLAQRFEGMVSRVARAEAALRASKAA